MKVDRWDFFAFFILHPSAFILDRSVLLGEHAVSKAAGQVRILALLLPLTLPSPRAARERVG